MTSYEDVSIETIKFNNPKRSKIEGLGHICSLKKTTFKEIELPQLKLYSSGVYDEEGVQYIDLLLGRTDKPLFVFMNKLDRHCLERIQANSADWYEKEWPIDVLESFYNNTIQSESNLPILKIMVDNSLILRDADDNEISLNQLKKNMSIKTSVCINGLSIGDENIRLNLVAHTIRTATRSKKVKTTPETPVQETEATTETPVETTEVETTETPVETTETPVETPVQETEATTTETPVETTEVETSEKTETTENTIEEGKTDVVVEKNIELKREEDNVSVSSSSSRRSRMSARTGMSSQISVQMDLVKKMHRDAVKAEKYANKKRLEAVRAMHELRTMELSEISSNYNSYNLDEQSEFIETASYLEG